MDKADGGSEGCDEEMVVGFGGNVIWKKESSNNESTIVEY